MIIKTATFVKSSVTLSDCPQRPLPEYAFIGRSNVGKSSLINMLSNNGRLAKISGTPGKTQTINHFLINDNWFLVDLPGYGFARIGRGEREKWSNFINEYILGREFLQYVFVLIDSRLEPQRIDLDFINFLGQNSIPFVIVFTKTDKNKPAQTLANRAKFEAALAETWDELPPIYMSSAKEKEGRDELLKFIDTWNKEWRQKKQD